MAILERFLKYVSVNTTSNSSSNDTPSTKEQFKLAELLVEELKEMNLGEVYFDKTNCYVYAKLPGNKKLPKIGFVSHLDTSEMQSGENVCPQIINNYDGRSIRLGNDDVLDVNVYPDLKNHVGKTLITTDGKTLLGADDKAGIAEIMEMMQLLSTSNCEHGDVLVCFTPDEEIGRGTKNLDYNIFNPDMAFTVDGSSLGEFTYENFNAATARISIKGFATHTGNAKGVLVNAARIATIINSLLPNELPENTSDREGFYFLYEMGGDVSSANMVYLIRDFNKENFNKRKEVITKIVERLNKEFNNCISLEIKDTYYNMYNDIKKNPLIIDNTLEAIKKVGVDPVIVATRGGTDGTNITSHGIPCPNIGTGGHNFHSKYEYICLEDMEKTVELLLSIVNQFTKDKRLVKNK